MEDSKGNTSMIDSRAWGICAATGWILLLLWLAAFQILAVGMSPKILQNSLGPDEYAEMINSSFSEVPLLHIRDFLTPVWNNSRYIVVLFLALSTIFTAKWWRQRVRQKATLRE